MKKGPMIENIKSTVIDKEWRLSSCIVILIEWNMKVEGVIWYNSDILS